jgi:hypothetical protein
MNALFRSRHDHKIPRGFQNAAWAQRLPELNVEFASWSAASHQPFHN